MLASVLFQFTHVADEYGLVDEEDVSLLEIERSRLARRIFIERVSMTAIAISMFAVFSLGVVAISLFTCSLIGLLVPRLICWCWSNGIDGRFHRFASELNQREMALFAVRSREARHSVPLYTQRVQCLRRLRFLSQLLANISADLVDEDCRGQLLQNFANAELIELASLDGEAGERSVEIASLKALWQYVYLLRSEFIRIAVVSLVNSSWVNLPSRLFNSLKCGALLSIPMPLKVPSMRRKGIEHLCYGPQACTSPLQQCRTQLEWILERLGEGSEIPEDVRTLIICLQNVISTLQQYTKEGVGEKKIQLEEDSLRLRIALRTSGDDDDDGGGDAKSIDSQAVDEYQIFEGEATSPHQLGHDLAENKNDSQPLQLNAPPLGRQSLMNELLSAISRRKEECMEREVEALAKLRRVPKAEVDRCELDRRIFPSGIASREVSQQRREEISRPTFGALPDADALRRIMAISGGGGGESVLGDNDDNVDMR